jgi:hypothetical protein
MSDTSPTGSPAGTPDEAFRLTALQRSALTYELRRRAELITEDDVRNNSTAGNIHRYLELADTIERISALGPVEIQSQELRDVAGINGWHNPSSLTAFREIAQALTEAHSRFEEAQAASDRRLAESTQPLAEALTFGINGATPEANNARASAAARALVAAAEGEEPIGAHAVVKHGGDLSAAVNTSELWEELQSRAEEQNTPDRAPQQTPIDVQVQRLVLRAILEARGDARHPKLDADDAEAYHRIELDIESAYYAGLAESLDLAATRDGRPREEGTAVEQAPTGEYRPRSEELPEHTDGGPRSAVDRIRTKLHLDSEARAERLSAVGITLRPQETSTIAVHERAQAPQPHAYGLEDVAR